MLGAIGLAACDNNDDANLDVDVNDADLLDDDDVVDIETPDGSIEIERDGDVQIED